MKRNATLILHHILWRGLYFFSILILNICIARFFAAEKSGHIFFIVNNLSFILLLVSISLESGAGHYIASGAINSSAMARISLIWATIASLLAAFSWWAILYFSHSSNLKLPGFLTASFLFILGVLYSTYFTALFYAKKEFVLPNKILFSVNILLVMLLIAGKFYLFIQEHFILIYFSSFFLQGVLLSSFFFKKDIPVRTKGIASIDMLRKVIQYSLIALVANAIYFLVNRIDYWFVGYFCSAKDLGNYIQASKLGQLLLILPGILGATLFPIFSSQKKYGNIKELSAIIKSLFWVNGIICLLILGLGWFILPFIFGGSFNEMYLLFVCLIPGILAFTMNYPLAAWFSASKRIGVNIRGGLIALVVICTGDILILPRNGVLSASLISSAGYLCFFIYTLSVYRHEFRIPFKDFIVIRKSDISLLRQSVGAKDPVAQPRNIVIQNPGI